MNRKATRWLGHSHIGLELRARLRMLRLGGPLYRLYRRPGFTILRRDPWGIRQTLGHFTRATVVTRNRGPLRGDSARDRGCHDRVCA